MRTPARRRSSRVLANAIEQLENRRLLSSVPTGFVEQVWGNISNGTAMDFAPDGRLFVLTQDGSVWVISSTGTLNPVRALGEVGNTLPVDSFFERGLLGVAFDPSFDAGAAGDDYVYLYYTDLNGANPSFNKISRFTVTGDTINTASETVIFSFNPLSAGNHNGGGLHFGPDGMLYAAHGENAVSSNSQTVTNLLGKVIRIDPDAFVAGNPESVIPGDNPASFIVRPGAVDVTVVPAGINRAIWAVGLRNPFTFAFQPGTGRMHINDVGQNNWEEINVGAAGANYGWPNTEGDFVQTSFPNFTRPLYTYVNDTTVAAISGGAFYNPAVHLFPQNATGDYFFGDLGSSANSTLSWVRRLDAASGYAFQTTGGVINGPNFVQNASNLVDVKVGQDGAVYYLQRGTLNGVSGVRRIVPTNPHITNSQFQFDGILLPSRPHELRFTFDENVGASITSADLLLENLTTSTTVPTGNIDVSYNAGTNTATFTFPGYTNAILPDGNYRATIDNLAVTDVDGNPLPADHVFNFFFLKGDANHDAIVNVNDFTILASNFNQTGRIFSQGDFTYDGTVNVNDFTILAGNFNVFLSGAAGQGQSRSALAGPRSALASTAKSPDVRRSEDDSRKLLGLLA